MDGSDVIAPLKKYWSKGSQKGDIEVVTAAVKMHWGPYQRGVCGGRWNWMDVPNPGELGYLCKCALACFQPLRQSAGPSLKNVEEAMAGAHCGIRLLLPWENPDGLCPDSSEVFFVLWRMRFMG